PGRVRARLGDVAQRRDVGERAELLQRLVLDLADPLARDVERPADLVERARDLAAEAVAQLEDPPLALGERAEDPLQLLAAEDRVRRVVRERHVVVGEEVPELGLVLLPDRLLERDGNLRAPHDRLDLLERKVEIERDLFGRRVAVELGPELPLGPDDLVELLDDVDGHPDRPPLVGERARDRLADPPRRVRRELVALPPVELLRGANETDRPLLDQVEERQALVAIALRDRDDEAEIRLDHLLLRAMVAALDPLRELDLLRGGEEIDLADVLQEQLQRVGRDLACLLVEARLLLLDRSTHNDDLDVELVERAMELLDLGRLQLELVERESELVGADRARHVQGLEEDSR